MEESKDSLIPQKRAVSKQSSAPSAKSYQKNKSKKKKKKETKAQVFAPKTKSKFIKGGSKNKPLKEIEEQSSESEKEREWPPPANSSASPPKK